jgi:catabolite repression protein CreC
LFFSPHKIHTECFSSKNGKLTSILFQPVPLARSQIQTQIREQQLLALGFTAAIDAPNRIANPKESFVASEGIYTLREEVVLSIPPPHPSEPLIMQPNPIGTSALPITAGTQACIITAGAPKQAGSTDSGSIASGVSGHSNVSDSVAAGAGIYAPLSPALKRKKPKNNIAKTNSSFVSRIITHENLTKRLAERKNDDVFAFVNISRAFEWLDMTTPDKVCLNSKSAN